VTIFSDRSGMAEVESDQFLLKIQLITLIQSFCIQIQEGLFDKISTVIATNIQNKNTDYEPGTS